MIIQKLHTNWKMKKCADTEYLPATVPGSIYHDLLSNKKMEDPFWRDNEDTAFAIMEHNFAVSEEFLGSDQIILRCEGLDPLADLYLKGSLIGKADNMHRIWEYEVKQVLKPGENSLHLVFHSPIALVYTFCVTHTCDFVRTRRLQTTHLHYARFSKLSRCPGQLPSSV